MTGPPWTAQTQDTQTQNTQPPDIPAGDLTVQVLRLAGHLRQHHRFNIGPGETAQALTALTVLNLGRWQEVRHGLRAILTAHPEQGRVFDAAFDTLVRRVGRPDPPQLPPVVPQTPAPPSSTPPSSVLPSPAPPSQTGPDTASAPALPPADTPTAAPTNTQEETHQDTASAATASQRAAQAPASPPRTLLTRLSPQEGSGPPPTLGGPELPDLLAAASALIAAVQQGTSRRWSPLPSGPRLDPRRTLRQATRTAGEPLHLHWRGHPRRPPRFVLVLDGSRSMGDTAALLLRFAWALGLRTRQVEVFVFSTRLHHLTPALRRARPGQRLSLPSLGEAWGGGTRIGDTLGLLTRQHRSLLTPQTVVLVLSDGLDTGELDPLRRALLDLKSRTRLLLWLSPLAGQPGYLPQQRAMQVAMPLVHQVLPARDLRDLQALGSRLRRGR